MDLESLRALLDPETFARVEAAQREAAASADPDDDPSAPRYVRIAPFDQKKGQLCRRINVGGRIFEEGTWYRVPANIVPHLAVQKQGDGVAVFEIMGEAAYRRAAGEDLGRALTALGGPAASFAPARPTPPPRDLPRDGPMPERIPDLSREKIAEVAPEVPRLDPPVVDVPATEPVLLTRRDDAPIFPPRRDTKPATESNGKPKPSTPQAPPRRDTKPATR